MRLRASELAQYWIAFIAQLVFHQSAKAGITQDRDRVLIAYNLNTDHCNALTADSKLEAKDAADLVCLWAFEALDRLEGNSCDEWRRPKCRLLDKAKNFQCSCEVANFYKVTAHEAVSFQDCAWKVSTEELLIGQTPLPSFHFRQMYQQIYEDAKLKATQQRVENMPVPAEAGTSRPSKSRRTADVASVRKKRRLAISPQNEGTPNASNTSHSSGSAATSSGAPRSQYLCNVCGNPYTSLHILRDHQLSHKMDLRCKFCNQSFSTKGNLTLHIKNLHSKTKESESAVTQSADDRPYVCDVCKKAYKRYTGLLAHRVVHKEDVRCKICNAGYANKSNLKYHMEQKHPVEAEAQRVEEEAQRLLRSSHVCYMCHARFSSRKKLLEHKLVHPEETTCYLCNKAFPKRSALSLHKRLAHSEPK